MLKYRNDQKVKKQDFFSHSQQLFQATSNSCHEINKFAILRGL